MELRRVEELQCKDATRSGVPQAEELKYKPVGGGSLIESAKRVKRPAAGDDEVASEKSSEYPTPSKYIGTIKEVDVEQSSMQ